MTLIEILQIIDQLIEYADYEGARTVLQELIKEEANSTFN